MDLTAAAIRLPSMADPSALFWRNKGVQSTTFERYGEEELTNDDDEKEEKKTAARNNAGTNPSWMRSGNGKTCNDDGSNNERETGRSLTLTEKERPTPQPNEDDDDTWKARFDQIQQLVHQMTPHNVSASATSTSDGDSSMANDDDHEDPPPNLWIRLAEEMVSNNDKELTQWLKHQLQTARNGKLHPSRAKRLLDLGLHWQELDQVWLQNYQRLLGNYRLLNATNKKKGVHDTPELQNWIVVQKMLSERHLLLPHREKQLLALARDVTTTTTTTTKDPAKTSSTLARTPSSHKGTATMGPPSSEGRFARRRGSDGRKAQLPPKKRKFIPFVKSPEAKDKEDNNETRPTKRSKSPNDVTEFDAAVAPPALPEPKELPKAAFSKPKAVPTLCLQEDNDDDDEVMEDVDVEDDKSSDNSSSREDKKKIPFTTDVWDESIQAAHDLVDWIM